MSETLSAALAAYIPRDRAAQIFGGAPLAGEGAAMIADISGFTPLAEALARALTPARGAEELTAALNGIFAPLIDAAHAYGGSVIKFGGDALILWFPRRGRAGPAPVMRRAIAAAQAMQAAVAAHGSLRTSAGTFRLTMKVGIAYGPALRVRLGDATHGYEDVIGGATLDRMAEAEHRARPGEVLADPAGLPDLAGLAELRGRRGAYLLLGPPLRPARRAPIPLPALEGRLAELRPYVPAEVAEALAAGREQPAELKPVVSIFVQFEGVRYDEPASAEAQLAAYFGAAQRAAARYGGRVNRLITGDKGSLLHLIFGAPRALEELDARAARCALELRDLARSMPFIRAQRVGMAAGRAFAGPVGAPARHDYTVMGGAINLSARLMQRAAPGQILLDGALAARLDPSFALGDLGRAQLKGLAEPTELFTLEGEAAARPAAPLAAVFGRAGELAALRGRVAGLASGRGGVAALVGELGMGKSHLLAALRAEGGARWAAASAPAYGGRPGGALIAAALAGLLGLGPAPAYPELEAACARLLGQRRGEAAGPYLARLLGVALDEPRSRELAALGGESLRWRLRELAGELAEAAAAAGPLVLALDDLQWADATSLELVEALLPAAERAPLLLILATRPERAARPWALLERLRAAGAGWLELGPLAADEAAALLRHHGPGLPGAALARLAERGGGNPLFLVELARAAAAAGPEAELPDSVHGLLLAQIDRLPGALRETIQLAALLGRTPDPRALAELSGSPGVESRLAALAGAGLMLREGAGYAFRHALVQESAYSALLYERRRSGHARAAEAIERLYPKELAERSAELAGHYERAGQLLAAARYRGQAADAARLLYANEEAEAGYRHLLALLDQLPGEPALRGRTLLKLAQVQTNIGDYAAAQELYDQAFALLEARAPAQRARGAARSGPPAFRLGVYPHGPSTLDPGLCEQSGDNEIVKDLFEGLVELDADLNIMPALARRWRVEDAGRRYLFELRPGLRWSDGAPLTAHDLVAAARRNLHPDSGAGLAQALYPIAGAEEYHQGLASDPASLGVAALSETLVEYRLAAATPHFLYLMADTIGMPQPQHAVARHGAGWARPPHLVCSGPFVPTLWEQGRPLRLERNPHYRGYAPGNLRRVELRYVAPDRERYRRGEIDWLRVEDRRELDEADATIEVIEPATYFLIFACAAPPFDRAEARLALAHAIDKAALVEQAWGGMQIAALGGVVPPGLPGHSPGINPPFDPAAARRLAAAGELLGRLGGRRPVLAARSGFGSAPDLLCAAWRAHLGLDVEPRPDVPGGELIAGLSSGAIAIALLGWELDYPEPGGLLRSLFHSAGQIIPLGWRSAAFDRLLADAEQAPDAPRRLRLYHEAERLLVAEQAPVVPLYYRRAHGLLRPGLRPAGGERVLRGERPRLKQILATEG